MENEELKDKFQEKVGYYHNLPLEQISKDFGLPVPDDFKNLSFELTLSERGYDIDKIFDPKIKEKIVKLLDKDRIKKSKADDKIAKKLLKSSKKWGIANLPKNLKKIEKDLERIEKLSENGNDQYTK